MLVSKNELSEYSISFVPFGSRLSYFSPRLKFLFICFISVLVVLIYSFWNVSIVVCASMSILARISGLVWDIHASLCLVVLNSSKVDVDWSLSIFGMYVFVP